MHKRIVLAFNNNFLCLNFKEEAIRATALSFELAFLQSDSTCGSYESLWSTLIPNNFSQQLVANGVFLTMN